MITWGEASEHMRRIIDGWSEDWQVAWNERAAIIEYDGGVERDKAERLAFVDIVRQRKLKQNGGEVAG